MADADYEERKTTNDNGKQRQPHAPLSKTEMEEIEDMKQFLPVVLGDIDNLSTVLNRIQTDISDLLIPLNNYLRAGILHIGQGHAVAFTNIPAPPTYETIVAYLDPGRSTSHLLWVRKSLHDHALWRGMMVADMSQQHLAKLVLSIKELSMSILESHDTRAEAKLSLKIVNDPEPNFGLYLEASAQWTRLKKIEDALSNEVRVARQRLRRAVDDPAQEWHDISKEVEKIILAD